MGIYLEWDNQAQTVLRCAFDAEWTWDDLYAIADEVKVITDSAPQTISAIIDLTNGMTIPGGNFFSPASLENARKLLTLGEGGTGPIAIVGASSLIKMVYTTFKGMDKRAAAAEVTFVDTLEQARSHLASLNP